MSSLGPSIWLVLGGLVGSAPAAAVQERPPNILLILADDLGAYDLGCYGGKDVRTPHLDALAAQGVRFATCYATPHCTTSRIELLTGKYGFRTGVYSNSGSREFDMAREKSFERLLRERGYATAIAGKWGIIGSPTVMGFDESCLWAVKKGARSYQQAMPLPDDAEYGGPTNSAGVTSRYWHPALVENGKFRATGPNDFGPDLFREFLVGFMRRHREQPFLAFYSMCLPHGETALGDEERAAVPVPDAGEPGSRRDGGFVAMKEYVDFEVGRLLAAVDELGLRDNTLVLFVADNGSLGPRGKDSSTEGGVWVPLIVRGPGVVAGRASEALVDLSDVLPTLAEVAGATVPEGIDGVSFVPALRGEPGTREWIFSFVRGERILRDRRWLLERNHATYPGDFFDCGGRTAGNAYGEQNSAYLDVSDSEDPEVLEARARFERILADLPAPELVPLKDARRVLDRERKR